MNYDEIVAGLRKNGGHVGPDKTRFEKYPDNDSLKLLGLMATEAVIRRNPEIPHEAFQLNSIAGFVITQDSFNSGNQFCAMYTACHSNLNYSIGRASVFVPWLPEDFQGGICGKHHDYIQYLTGDKSPYKELLDVSEVIRDGDRVICVTNNGKSIKQQCLLQNFGIAVRQAYDSNFPFRHRESLEKAAAEIGESFTPIEYYLLGLLIGKSSDITGTNKVNVQPFTSSHKFIDLTGGLELLLSQSPGQPAARTRSNSMWTDNYRPSMKSFLNSCDNLRHDVVTIKGMFSNENIRVYDIHDFVKAWVSFKESSNLTQLFKEAV